MDNEPLNKLQMNAWGTFEEGFLQGDENQTADYVTPEDVFLIDF